MNAVETDNPNAVADFCRRVTLRVRFAIDDGPVPEAQIAVNDRCFSKIELEAVPEPTSSMPAFAPLREKVNEALRLCEFDARVIMLGREIGFAVFPQTPYKFFFHSTKGIRHQSELEGFTYPGLRNPSRDEHHCVTRTWNGFKILMMDAARFSPSETGPFILGDAVLRAMEAGDYGRKRMAREPSQ